MCISLARATLGSTSLPQSKISAKIVLTLPEDTSPYISFHMLEAKNTDYYNVKGIQINDPSINYNDVMTEAPAIWQLNDYAPIFGLNKTTMDHLNALNEKCGYDEFMTNALTYPPTGPIPTAPDSTKHGCNVWEQSLSAAIYINPCFNFYHIIDYCPFLWDELGFPSLGWGPRDYFNRTVSTS